ncbi:c-type cytochrome [Flavobacterium lacus]|uniref:Quinol:cytochrome c oxidoreductase pentaheme cytochrome subunit n=1 Tax=Flavobacterium lacus TaxID=1353778 RepID=A0A328WSL7_9FLAO|nr:c-type cytochrome [Flavobacterium lacus]RAR48136.1 quinol:cytochrome c oxidoreductase pentaheme cytochrome subunit [Flavobacterium lacus]
MKKVGNPNSISRILLFSLAFMLTFSIQIFAQDAATMVPAADAPVASAPVGDAAAGKAIFNAQCAACHKLDAKMTGPALRGVGAKYEKEWLYKWIRNSAELIKSGDERANKIFNEYNQSPMNAFPQLSDADLDNIIAYTMEPKAAPVATTEVAAVPGGKVEGGGISNEVILGALALVLAMLVVMLLLVNSVLTKIAKANGIEAAQKEKTLPIWKAFAKNQFLVLVTVIFLLLSSAYFAYGWFMQIGVDQGYEPIQPIHYSHRIHAGDNGIDCKYCHSSARDSKHSGIPSLNVCMNCHKSIAEVAETTLAEGKEFGVDYNQEIQKLYDAVGWDVAEQKYTGKTQPVKWIRIHNLPDFAYFNHAQHVTVAGIECQTCHGPVEEMEIMYQHSPLTMGWCINCHRETDVKLKDNDYYKKIHEELSKKYGVDKLTAAQMGGLECGKCHY